MKIVKKDAYGKEQPQVVATNVPEDEAKKIVKTMNLMEASKKYYYQVVSDDFVVYTGQTGSVGKLGNC